MSPTGLGRPSSRTYLSEVLSRRSASPVPHHVPCGSFENTFVGPLGSPSHPAIQPIHNQEKQVLTTHASTLVSLPFTSPAVTQSTTEVLKKLVGRHVLNAGMFNKNELHALFNLAQFFRNSVHKDRAIDNILKVSFSFMHICWVD